LYAIEIFYSEEDMCFIAIVPELPGCSAFGRTAEAALKEVKTAMQLWLDMARENGIEIPVPQNRLITVESWAYTSQFLIAA
jgi:predicted RNase H-like HicB family nuclease